MSTPTVFEGVRVVDFTQGFAGALVTMVMADNGATVTHIEPPPDSGRPADPSKAGLATGNGSGARKPWRWT